MASLHRHGWSVILHARDYRRLLNRFIDFGTLQSLEGGGMRVRMDGANFSYRHKAVWEDVPYQKKKDFIAEDVLEGQGWTITLLDTTDGGRGRLLTEIVVLGNREKARKDLLFALNCVYM